MDGDQEGAALHAQELPLDFLAHGRLVWLRAAQAMQVPFLLPASQVEPERMTMEYDMDDVKIRAMVEVQHSPREFRASNHLGQLLAQTIRCVFCNETWPCDARSQLMAWHEERARAREDSIEVARATFDNGEGP